MSSIRAQIEWWADARRGFDVMRRRGQIHPYIAQMYIQACNWAMTQLRRVETFERHVGARTASMSNVTQRHSPVRSTATSRIRNSRH